jgi:beta-lactamase regulating signal transducer with metallopeptidase domain
LGLFVVVRLLLPAVPELPGHPFVLLQHLSSGNTAAFSADILPGASLSTAAAPTVNGVPAPQIQAGFSGTPWFAGLWALGVVGTFAWIARSQWLLHRLVRRAARPADPSLLPHLAWARQRMGIGKKVSLLEVEGLPTVALWGWRRPQILVPSGLSDRFTADEIRGMFLHELAHVSRHDVLWTWLALAAAALHWFNPLAWLALRRLRADRELECDRLALKGLTDPQRRSYGLALLRTLESRVTPLPVGSMVPFGQRVPDLRTRIKMIAVPTSAGWSHRWSVVALPLMALVTFTRVEAGPESDGPPPPAAPAAPEAAPVRDGEGPRKGPRDGEQKKQGPRDGEAKKAGPRDGESKKPGPRDGGREAKVPGDKLVVFIAADGSLAVGGRTMGEEALLALLKQAALLQDGYPVEIQAHESTPYNKVLRALNLCQQARLWNLSFATPSGSQKR